MARAGLAHNVVVYGALTLLLRKEVDMVGRVRSGKIVRLTADRRGAFLVMDNDPAGGPKDNTWQLSRDHENYNAVYSLCLAAAANQWRIAIHISGDEDINIEREAGVRSVDVTPV